MKLELRRLSNNNQFVVTDDKGTVLPGQTNLEITSPCNDMGTIKVTFHLLSSMNHYNHGIVINTKEVSK